MKSAELDMVQGLFDLGANEDYILRLHCSDLSFMADLQIPRRGRTFEGWSYDSITEAVDDVLRQWREANEK